MAAPDGGVGASLAWIVTAFTAARAFAMAMNRILDREFDAQNPRTAGRHLPTGAISPAAASGFAAACAGVLVFSAWKLNPLCFYLSPLLLAYLTFYSLTKRFTQWSHLALGAALGAAPIAAEIAILGAVTAPTLVLGLAVVFWVAGFDVFYACQDIDFDHRAGLFSLPARLGKDKALRAAQGFHTLTLMLFFGYGHLAGLGRIYFLSQAVVLGLLIYEHVLARHGRIGPAFFQLNGILSLLQLSAVAADIAFGSV